MLPDGLLIKMPLCPAAVLKDFEMESAADSAFVNMVLVDMTEYARQHSDKAVKKTLSIPM